MVQQVPHHEGNSIVEEFFLVSDPTSVFDAGLEFLDFVFGQVSEQPDSMGVVEELVNVSDLMCESCMQMLQERKDSFASPWCL